ncbi:cytochrome C6 [Haematobacter genomosp. 1]|uniref:Cytochrome C6 n=2 Tax=Paracoccaceae TaxID=31989 RepID=A0A212AB44_9RHOB|nr:cytochrome C6 [Haematobacter genomosp. 1]
MTQMKTFLTAAFALLAAPALADDPELFKSPTVLTQKSGEAIYNAICAGCHMPQGEGAVGAGHYPALATNPMLEGADYPVYIVLHGQKAMPAIGSLLDDAQVAEVVNYIRTHFGNDYQEPATPEMVKAAR